MRRGRKAKHLCMIHACLYRSMVQMHVVTCDQHDLFRSTGGTTRNCAGVLPLPGTKSSDYSAAALFTARICPKRIKRTDWKVVSRAKAPWQPRVRERGLNALVRKGSVQLQSQTVKLGLASNCNAAKSGDILNDLRSCSLHAVGSNTVRVPPT